MSTYMLVKARLWYSCDQEREPGLVGSVQVRLALFASDRRHPVQGTSAVPILLISLGSPLYFRLEVCDRHSFSCGKVKCYIWAQGCNRSKSTNVLSIGQRQGCRRRAVMVGAEVAPWLRDRSTNHEIPGLNLATSINSAGSHQQVTLSQPQLTCLQYRTGLFVRITS